MTGKRFSIGFAQILFAGFVLVCLIAGCAGHTTTPSQQDNLTGTPDTVETDSIPTLSAVAREVSYIQGRFRHGKDYAQTFSSKVEVDGNNLRFNPGFLPENPWNSTDLAYAVFQYQVDGYDDLPEIHFNWALPPLDSSLWYLGLSNWETDSWKWATGEVYSKLTFESLDPYIDDNGNLLLIVVLGGMNPAILSNLMLGQDVESLSIAPVLGGIYNNFGLSFAIETGDPNSKVEIDFNYDPNAVLGDELASFGQAPYQNRIVYSGALESGNQEISTFLWNLNAGENLFAVKVTDSFDNQHLFWNSQSVHLIQNWMIELVVTGIENIGGSQYIVSFAGSVPAGSEPFDAIFDPAFELETLDPLNPLGMFGDLIGEFPISNISWGEEDPDMFVGSVNVFIGSGERTVALRLQDSIGNQLLYVAHNVRFGSE